MTTLTFRVPDELDQFLEEICKEADRSKSWFMRKALEEKLEEWRDAKNAMKAKGEYDRDPSMLLDHDEVWQELGFKKQK